jgi:hypothetical protein
VTLVINGTVLVIGGMLPWPLMVALGLTSGGKNISDAWQGKDLFTEKELSTGDRILRGLSGVADVALAGYGTYKGLKPVKGTNKVVVSEKASGVKIPEVEINNLLSKRNIKHIQTRHNVDSIKSQAEYLSDAQLAEKLKDQSFFNSKWTTDEITKYSEIAYNDLLKPL